MKENPLFKIDSSFQYFVLYFFRFILLGIISILLFNFKVNEFLFSLMIGIALMIILFSGSAIMFVFEDRFEIRSSAFLKVLNKKQIYYYKDLEYVEYSKAELNPMNLIYYVPGTNKENEYLIKFKEGKKEKYIRKVGSKDQSIQAIRLINKKISQLST